MSSRHQRIKLIQSRNPRIDLTRGCGWRENNQFHGPGNVEVALRFCCSHEVIVTFDRRTRLTAIEVHATLIGAGQNAVNRAWKWKHVDVIAVGGLAIQMALPLE